ncbi:hypothetical protein [Sphingobacterium sp.]|uniref:hypothetical protein n=1 Tax=Sphingobacterium sp. TaxID=341027 RepID=UPI0028A1BC92|nr:hypothetical protein [Sphingobacterium sp.]
MYLKPILLTCIQLLFVCLLNLSGKNPYAHLLDIRGEKAMLEGVLRSKVHFGSDTLAIHKNLDPLLDFAIEKHNYKLKWAYYMLMADAFSIAFDKPNDRTDRYFELALNTIADENEEGLEMLTNIRWGYYYFTYRNLERAFPYFLRANDFNERVLSATIPLVPLHYGYMANFYSYIGDHKKAVVYLQLGIPYTEELSRKRIDMFNAVAVYLKRDSQMSESEDYFKHALKVAEKAKDSVWIGIISGNLADFERSRGNLDKCLELIQRNITYSEKFNEPLDAMRANIAIADVYIQRRQWKDAKEALYKAEGYVEDKPYFLQYKKDIAKAFADIAHGEGNNPKELIHLQEYLALNDSLTKQSNYEMMQKIYWQWESERYSQAVAAAEMKKVQAQQKYQLIGVLLLLTFVIILLLINRARNKERIRSTLLEKEQLRLAFEKNQVDQELLVLRDSLEEFTNTIKQNDATIQQLRLEVKHGEDLDPAYQEKINDSLSDMLETHIMTDERWIKFKEVFDRVYPGFLIGQKAIYPKLSENDLRLLALMKLDLSNRSMGDLLGVSIEAIKKAKQRLKKKQEIIETQV